MTVRTVRVLLLFVPLMSGLASSDTDPETGLVIAPGYDLVKVQCTVCHSAALITQSRATRTGWLDMIRWMRRVTAKIAVLFPSRRLHCFQRFTCPTRRES